MKLLRIPIFLLVLVALSSCGQLPQFQTATPEPSLTPTVFPPTKTITRTSRPTQTPSPTLTPTPTPIPLTWMELNVFLASDHTNWNEWIADKYTCVNFAIDLVASARRQNIDAWIVGVSFENSDTGHAFVAFQTTDRGEVWIEPQSDYSYYAVQVGSPLCYAVDTSICDDSGRVVKVEEHLECDPETSMCRLP